jgi:hypothetical protein
MKRQHQMLLIAATLALSWLAMQAVHEFGHVAAAVVSGGQVDRIILHPTKLSQTLLAKNPHPLFVAWMGPVVGAVFPLVPLAAAKMVNWSGWFLTQFFAGFCLVANGAYLAGGSLYPAGDAADLLMLDAPVGLLWLFGLITICLGLWFWNRLGPYFGLGADRRPVKPALAYMVGAVFVVVVALEMALA